MEIGEELVFLSELVFRGIWRGIDVLEGLGMP